MHACSVVDERSSNMRMPYQSISILCRRYSSNTFTYIEKTFSLRIVPSRAFHFVFSPSPMVAGVAASVHCVGILHQPMKQRMNIDFPMALPWSRWCNSSSQFVFRFQLERSRARSLYYSTMSACFACARDTARRRINSRVKRWPLNLISVSH